MLWRIMAIHTERIHEDLVWERLRRVLMLLCRKGSRATLFVYPFRSVVAGRSDTALERVKQAFRQGHEIAQHTHFYKGELVDKPNKVTDLSRDNVTLCLERDQQWLSQVARPRGFTSGGWVVPQHLYPVLMKMGFDYACSARRVGLGEKEEGSFKVWLNRPEILRVGGGKLLLIPTTHGLRDALLRLRSSDLPAGFDGIHYRLVYFHDYDLLRWKAYLAVLTLVLVGGPWNTCGALSDLIKGRLDGNEL